MYTERVMMNETARNRIETFRLRIDRISAFCRKYHVRRFALFGSVLREDFRPESDVDVLVEFEPGRVPGFIGLGSMSANLSEIFDGHPADLRTPEDLSPYFREEVLAGAETLYGK